MTRAPELHPLLQCEPSLASRTAAAIQQMANEANMLVDLIEKLKKGVRLSEACPDGPATHLRQIERREYRDACATIFTYAAHNIT